MPFRLCPRLLAKQVTWPSPESRGRKTLHHREALAGHNCPEELGAGAIPCQRPTVAECVFLPLDPALAESASFNLEVKPFALSLLH